MDATADDQTTSLAVSQEVSPENIGQQSTTIPVELSTRFLEHLVSTCTLRRRRHLKS
jgi:hypothetical protein